jgi:polyhydroxyalkanoate synthase
MSSVPDFSAALEALAKAWEPHNQALSALQDEWRSSHSRLWQTMLERRAGSDSLPVAKPEPGDRRFEHPAWASSPVFDYLRQAYLVNAQYFRQAVEALPVDDEHTRDRMRFMARQFIDAAAPTNFLATNPEFVQRAVDTQGESIKQGIQNLLADLEKGRISMTDESAFEVGRNLAVTPGAVVFENELMQLIQYAPLTEAVAKRPLVIVPPCINKYYILDLKPENSFVRYAVEQGNTVFLVSWRNPQVEHGHLQWDDYIERGALTALRVAREIARVDQVNALGFCVGGTILSSALAVSRARGEQIVASLTLLTTLLDFSQAGELSCFVDETSVAARENTIGKGGLLSGRELSAVFSALRANDLIWQYVVGNYLMGSKPTAFDLLYWNSDSTNLPGPFAVWYLRNMYLENNLRLPGKLTMCGESVDLGRVDMPAFILATREDHIVPWQSSFLGKRLLGGETTFVLGASGHIAGVINPATKDKRSYWSNEADVADANEWLASASETKGSWWPRWSAWLARHAGGEVKARVKLGNKKHPPGEAAPGRYVKEKAN